MASVTREFEVLKFGVSEGRVTEKRKDGVRERVGVGRPPGLRVAAG